MTTFRFDLPMTEDEAGALMQLAIGRLFRLGSRPTQPGDDIEFEKLKSVVGRCAEVLPLRLADNNPNYVRDRNRGAAGD